MNNKLIYKFVLGNCIITNRSSLIGLDSKNNLISSAVSSYTATVDCWAVITTPGSSGNTVYIDGVEIFSESAYAQFNTASLFPVKKGQTISVSASGTIKKIFGVKY